MCLVGVVVRRYMHFLILLIPTPLVFALFGSSIPTLLFIFVNVFRSCFCPFLFIIFFLIFFVLVSVLFCNLCKFCAI